MLSEEKAERDVMMFLGIALRQPLVTGFQFWSKDSLVVGACSGYGRTLREGFLAGVGSRGLPPRLLPYLPTTLEGVESSHVGWPAFLPVDFNDAVSRGPPPLSAIPPRMRLQILSESKKAKFSRGQVTHPGGTAC